jgi:N-acetylmuramoyl-L-alanine amidase
MSRTTLKHRWHPSPNHNARRDVTKPWIIVLHYTGMNSAEAARDWLCNSQSAVSCHYLVDEEGGITQMVDEELRAWHAGVSRWKGHNDINSASIGIEIHNPGHDLGYKDFPDAQIDAVTALCRDIVSRHTILAQNIVAHSDVAPMRKIDPGEKFPWAKLHGGGVGHWIAPEPVTAGPLLKSGDAGADVEELRRMLAAYGYDVERTGPFDHSLGIVVKAFQRHFRPAQVDGVADRSTLSTLQKLLAGLAHSQKQ